MIKKGCVLHAFYRVLGRNKAATCPQTWHPMALTSPNLPQDGLAWPQLGPQDSLNMATSLNSGHLGTEVGFDRKFRILPCCLAVLGIILPCGCKLYAFHMPPTSPNKAPTWPKHCPRQHGPTWPTMAQHSPNMPTCPQDVPVGRKPKSLAMPRHCRSLQVAAALQIGCGFCRRPPTKSFTLVVLSRF